jgi:hypothetical protein
MKMRPLHQARPRSIGRLIATWAQKGILGEGALYENVCIWVDDDDILKMGGTNSRGYEPGNASASLSSRVHKCNVGTYLPPHTTAVPLIFEPAGLERPSSSRSLRMVNFAYVKRLRTLPIPHVVAPRMKRESSRVDETNCMLAGERGVD